MDPDNAFTTAAWVAAIVVIFAMMTSCAVTQTKLCVDNGYAADCRIAELVL